MSQGKSAEKSSRRQVGLTGAIVNLTINIFWMGLLVWFLLFVGFGCYRLVYPDTNLSHQLQTILKPNREFLQNRHWLKNIGDSIQSTSLYEKLQEVKHRLPEIPWVAQSRWHSLKQEMMPLIYGVTHMVITRFLAFCLVIPLFLLCLSLGFIDGIVQRDIRKFQVARESTLLFHVLKHHSVFWFYIPFFIYWVLPLPISPPWFLIPVAIILSVFVQWSTKSFKKYI